MKNRKYIQIITDTGIWKKWSELAKSKGMPLVTYIKHLLNNELEK